MAGRSEVITCSVGQYSPSRFPYSFRSLIIVISTERTANKHNGHSVRASKQIPSLTETYIFTRINVYGFRKTSFCGSLMVCFLCPAIHLRPTKERLWKSVGKIQMRLLSGIFIETFTRRPKYVLLLQASFYDHNSFLLNVKWYKAL
jgi:hypothetical protein